MLETKNSTELLFKSNKLRKINIRQNWYYLMQDE